MKWSDYLLPSVGYSTHNLSTTKRFSASPGILYPVWHRLMLPGDKFSINMRHLIRTNATKAPLMGRFKVRFVTVVSNLKNYALSLEGYNRSFDWRATPLPNFRFIYPGTGTGAQEYKPGVISYMAVRETSLADYLGYQRGWLPTVDTYPMGYGNINEGSVAPYSHLLNKSAFPFLVYYDFYRNYMLNPQEGFWPMFRAVADYAKLPDGTMYPTAKSVIAMQTPGMLDTLFRNVHRLYDQVPEVSDVNNPIPSTDQGDDVKTPVAPFISTAANDAASEGNSIMPFIWDARPEYFNQLITTPVPDGGMFVNDFSAYHGGLCATMFDPDINTSWLSVSNYNRLNDVKVTSKTSGSVTSTSFQDIVKASSLWQFVIGEIYGGGTYADHIYSQYGVSVRGDLNIPQVVHVYDSSVDFEDITSQSDTYNGNENADIAGAKIGEQYGVGRGYGQSSRFTIRNIDKNYAMAMTFMWITPMVDYATGIPADTNIVRLNDIYVPAFDNYAMQPRLQEQLNSAVVMDGSEDPFAPNAVYSPSSSPRLSDRIVLGYQPSWSEYKTDINTVHGLFKNQLSYWAILRKIPPIGRLSQAATLSSYVYSAPRGSVLDADEAIGYDVPFSVVNEDNFQCQVRFDIKAVRPMRKSAIPHVK